MRCPKCSYLSYEEVARCRNCGYDFGLAAPRADLTEMPALDAPGETRAWQEPPLRGVPGPVDLLPAADDGSAVDLPLFESPDRPSAPARPEPPPMTIPPVAPPLVVRRKIDVARPPTGPPAARTAQRPPDAARPALDFDEPSDLAAPAELDRTLSHDRLAVPEQDPPQADNDSREGPSSGARMLAGVVDAALLLGIDTAVVWLTLRMLELTWDDWRVLPLAPLFGFLFLLDTSYLVTFTAASGQSIGKMMTGLRVADEDGGRVPFGHAVVRSVVALLCTLPAGLGLLPILFDVQGRGLHDRVAGTRVVDAS